MGISIMQGTPWHIEYAKGACKNKRKVNCGFWKDGICFNNISIKYGEEYHSKNGCLYSK